MNIKQEYQVNKILPAIRRLMCVLLKNSMGYRHKKISEMMCLTEASVSQYLSDKRGMGYKFNLKQESIVRYYAVKINHNSDVKSTLEKCLEEVYKWDVIHNTTKKPK